VCNGIVGCKLTSAPPVRPVYVSKSYLTGLLLGVTLNGVIQGDIALELDVKTVFSTNMYSA